MSTCYQTMLSLSEDAAGAGKPEQTPTPSSLFRHADTCRYSSTLTLLAYRNQG